MRLALEKKESRSADFDFHIKILEFSGTLQAKEFIDLLNEVERIFLIQ